MVIIPTTTLLIQNILLFCWH